MQQERSLKRRQNEWQGNEQMAQWTKCLIPDTREWIKCLHRRSNYFLTQELTRHGAFKAYTKTIGKSKNDFCRFCERVDTVEHTISGKDKWNAGHEMIKIIMKEKERKGRIRRERERD
ncbi:hypothetical protein NQ317_009471 [Molorchus minor]|uniref:Uncharacterized protein n=1 Tax=Molorchus minor TaxID=1323400 RepID=A0ABQ9J778_9CUCU|nr:hypothetical protein NQ317_009471 [Molorchus minor]